MSLPVKVIDRLFERLGATYGGAWTRQWSGVPMSDVKSAWAHELQGFAGRLESLAWALENLPERCPNVIEFRNIARRAPSPEMQKLPEPKADPERLRAELAKLSEVRRSVEQRPGNGRDWARRIMGRFAAGERINPTSLQFARQAMRGNFYQKGGE